MIGPLLRAVVIATTAFSGAAALAATVEATRTLRSGTVIHSSDVKPAHGDPRRGEIDTMDQAIGMEVRSSIRQGRKIRYSDLRQPILVERNQLVDIIYRRGSLVIRGEGRALRKGGKGEAIRVMNLDSRMIVTGRVSESGRVEVSP